ncbi:MAG: tyrosine-type recombinase/integrase [Nanoarchaeota archaeon]|nr:tyrosine-type recombinase/integrase [Nanoarchaeota archaeon]
MLAHYPDFRKEHITSEALYRSLSKPEQQIVEEFLQFCAISAGVKKVADTRGIILQIRHVIGKQLDSLSLNDVRTFLAVLNTSDKRDWTKHGIKITFKKFLKWKYPDWSSRFSELQDIKLKKISTQDRYTEDKLLTEQDVEALIRCAETLRDKALLMLLFETGARPQELLNLRWKHIQYEGNHGIVTIFSNKTQEARSVPIKECVLHLKRWHQEFSFPNAKPSDFVFPSVRERTKAMTLTLVWYYLKRYTRKAGIQKNVYAYLFRHARARELYEELPEQLAKKLLGHAKDSRMPAVYSHPRDTKAIQAMLQKIYHVEELTQEQQNRLEREVAFRLLKTLASIQAILSFSNLDTPRSFSHSGSMSSQNLD